MSNKIPEELGWMGWQANNALQSFREVTGFNIVFMSDKSVRVRMYRDGVILMEMNGILPEKLFMDNKRW